MTTFTDERGCIRNIGHASIIESKAGSVRSNHYHKAGWHYLYVVSGAMRYKEKDAPGGTVILDRLVEPGQMVHTGPNAPHRTEFLEDTVMISLQSEHAHDEDLVRVEW